VDLNGDHKTDLLVSSPGIGLAVLLGNGDGTFQPPQPVPGTIPYVVQAADLNGDGIPDLAVTVAIGGGLIPVGAALVILPGKGDGTFGTPTYYGLGFTPWAAIAIADLNRDGKPDIAAVTGGYLTVFLNDGRGSFTETSFAGEPWNFAPGIVAADFDGDGLLDLAVTSQTVNGGGQGTTTILLGRSDGTFTVAYSFQTASFFSQIVAADLNDDGHVDLVEGLPIDSGGIGAAGVVFFAGRGDGTFENGGAFGGSGNSRYLALADFTGSGVMGFAGTNDLATADSVAIDGNLVVLPRAVWPPLTLANISAAGFGLGPMAPGSMATAFGFDLATATAQAATPQVSLGGATVSVTDSAGAVRQAPLFYVSPEQVNYLIPAGTAPGLASVSVAAEGTVTGTGQIAIAPVAPALFTVNAARLAAANVVLVDLDGHQTFESIYQTDESEGVVGVPIDFGSATDSVYLVLYGTGIRGLTSLSAVTATIDWAVSLSVTYAGPQGLNNPDGLDQVNLQLPRSLVAAAPYTGTLQLNVDGQPSNPVTLLIQ
jgi:uncharacterized protein (TIGR03437 family)